MYKGNSSRVVPIVIVLIVIALAIAALVAAGRAIFGGDSSKPAQVDTAQNALLDTAANHSVRMTVRGPIVADENFRSYQVVINSSSRSLTAYSGYLESPISAQSLGNNVRAYEQLVYALDNANMMRGTALEGEDDDLRGICATGRVFEFDVLVDNRSVKHLWTSTCKGSKGSFKASVAQVQNLFLEQIPENKEILNKIDL